MKISFNFIMKIILILVFLFIECQTGIVLKNFKSRRTLMAELAKESVEAKARLDDNVANAIDVSNDQIKINHPTGSFNKPSNQISPRMKHESKTSKKSKAKGGLKFKSVAEKVMNKNEEVRKQSKHSNGIHTSPEPKNQIKVEVKNQTQPLKQPMSPKNITEIMNKTKEEKLSKHSTGIQTSPNLKTKVKVEIKNQTEPLVSPKEISKGTNKLSTLTELNKVDRKMTNKTEHRKAPKPKNSLKPTNIKFMGINVTTTVNRTLTKIANLNVTTFVHVNVTNLKSNATETMHLNLSAISSNITDVINLNVTMVVKPNVTEVVHLNVTEAAHLNTTGGLKSNATEVVLLNITKTIKPNVTEVMNINVTDAVKQDNTEVVHLNITMDLRPNVTEATQPNVTEVVSLNITMAVKPNVTEVMLLNITLAVKPNVTEILRLNITEAVKPNSTEAINLTIIELINSNITEIVNASSKLEKNTGEGNLERSNIKLQNVKSTSSNSNSIILNESVKKTIANLDNLNINSSPNKSDIKDALPIENNSINLLRLKSENFNSSLKNSSNTVNPINVINKNNSSVLRDSSKTPKESVALKKTSGKPIEKMKQMNNTVDLNSGNKKAVVKHKDQKNAADSKELSLKLDNSEKLKVRSNDTDKIKQNTGLSTLLTTNTSDEVVSLNVNDSMPSTENLDPLFNFSFPISLPSVISNSSIFESIVNLSKIILTDEINPESVPITEKPSAQSLNKSSDALLINETDIVENTQNKPNKQDIFDLDNERIDKNKNESKLSEPTKVNKNQGVDPETVTMVLLPEESNSTQIVSGLDFLVNSEVAKNAVLAMDVFNLSDTSLTDHVIEDTDIHSIIDLMMPVLPKTEQSFSSSQRATEVESPPQKATSITDNIRNESHVEAEPSNDSQLQDIETEINNSTEIIEVFKCPRPSLCLFWFASRDLCSDHNECPGSKLCCKVRCSKHCIDVKPQHD